MIGACGVLGNVGKSLLMRDAALSALLVPHLKHLECCPDESLDVSRLLVLSQLTHLESLSLDVDEVSAESCGAVAVALPALVKLQSLTLTGMPSAAEAFNISCLSRMEQLTSLDAVCSSQELGKSFELKTLHELTLGAFGGSAGPFPVTLSHMRF